MFQIHLPRPTSVLNFRVMASLVVLLAVAAPPSAAAATEQMLQRVSMPASFDPTNCVQPVWPTGAREAGKAGTVVLAYLVGKDGQPKQSRVLRTSGYSDLDEAARVALFKCAFRPGTINDEPAEAWMQVEYKWMQSATSH